MIVIPAQRCEVADGHFGFAAFDTDPMEEALGPFEGHRRARAPFIVQRSKGARRHAGTGVIEAIPLGEEGYPDALFPTHGSSSVPREEMERINVAGGAPDPSARGVDEARFSRALPLGSEA